MGCIYPNVWHPNHLLRIFSALPIDKALYNTSFEEQLWNAAIADAGDKAFMMNEVGCSHVQWDVLVFSLKKVG